MTVSSSEAIKRFKNDESSVLEEIENGKYKTHSPDGYAFYLVDKDKKKGIIDILIILWKRHVNKLILLKI